MKNQIKYTLSLISLLFVITIAAQVRTIGKPISTATASTVNAKYLPLYQWYSPSRGDNFLTTNPNWVGKRGAKKGPDYRFVRIEGYIFSPLNKQPANTMPVYSWYSVSRGDNFLTTNPLYAPSKKIIQGYKFVRKEGYINKKKFINGIVLQSHWSLSRKDNFATAHPKYSSALVKKISPDYKLYRTEGYVIDPTKIGAFNTSTLALATKPTVFKKAYMLNSKAFSVIPPKTETSSESTSRQGVNMETYEDLSDLLGDVKFESFLEKLNISREIFPDENSGSNYYYYLPSTYTLKWDKDSGKYAFKIFYLSTENGNNPEVLIKVELVSNINKKDLELAESFLRSKLNNNKIELIPMPVQGVSIDFGSALTNFSVKPESVSINATSDYLQPIVVEWKMESKVDDFVSAMLSDFGLDAMVNFLLDDGESVLSVPLNLQISDPITFGKLEVKNPNEIKTGWINYLDYPVVLNQLVAHKNRSNYLSTFALDNVQVAPGETFTYTKKILSNTAFDRLWMDYSIVECAACKEVVRKKIIGGTSGSQITDLEIQILNIMETSEAYMFKLNIKSKQADPNGMQEVKFPSITIKEDDQSFSGGKYYVPEKEELTYEYQLIQIMPDGETYTSPWHTSNQSFLVIGASQLENIFKAETEEGWKDGEDLNSLKDSLVDKGKELLENLFKKKDDDEKDKENIED